MGQCYSKQQQQSLRTTTKTPKPQKCILLQNPPSLILELSNGNVETVSIRINFTGSQLQNRLDSGIYFGAANQLYLCVEGDSINDDRILQAVHVYYQSIGEQGNGGIQSECAYFVRNENKVAFIVKSKSLGQGHKFADLGDLGRRMKDKKICWQDLEFSEIVLQICRKYAKTNYKQQVIRNILIGSDGSIHLLTFPSPESSPTKSLNHLQQLLLTSLYGLPKNTPIKQPNQHEKSSQFKHNNTLSLLQNLPTTIQQQKNNKYTPITNPSLKFIRDYITAYYYKFQVYDAEMVDMMVMVGQYSNAGVVLDQFMSAKGYYQIVDEETYKMYVKLLVIENGKDAKSQETATARARVCSAATTLAKSSKQKNNYLQSYYYYSEALTHKTSAISPNTNYKLNEQFYVDFAQVCRALNKNMEVQSVLLGGLDENPSSKLLNLGIIVYLCDCMRVDEAEERLMKATAGFKTLQMQISSAKLLLTRATLNATKRAELLSKAQEQLSKVLIQQYDKSPQKSSSVPSQFPTLALYHQTLGDCHLQKHSFSTAKQQYHTSKLIIKNYENCGYRLATLTAAQANCQLMQGKYDEAIDIYTEASGYITTQCKNLMDSVIGNRAIAKIRKGLHEQGRKEIETILQSTPKDILFADYNYTFLKNVLSTSRNSEK